MELKQITFQRGRVRDEEPWSQTYKREFDSMVTPHSPYSSVVAPMTELLHCMETEVEAPTCWVFTSLLRVVFCRCDVAIHPEGLDEAFLFDLSYAPLNGWKAPAFAIEDFNKRRYQPETVDEAIQTIVSILRHAEIFGTNEDGENSPAKLEL